MSTDPREERLARRIADLYATDPQFANARPIAALTEAIEQPGLRLPRIVRTVMGAYAERPAVGERAVNLVTDPETGRTSLELLPWFETVTYRGLWERVGAVVRALTNGPGHPVRPGDRVCVLGFTSVDYATVDMALVQLGAVSVPLQTNAPVSQLRPIVAETAPRVFASSIDDLGDAVELVLTGHVPNRLVVFDYARRWTSSARRSKRPGQGWRKWAARWWWSLWPSCSNVASRCWPHRSSFPTTMTTR